MHVGKLNDAMPCVCCIPAKEFGCREHGGGVVTTKNLCLRGVSFVEDLEQYLQLPRDQQKRFKVRVTFFGREAETLLDLSAAQVVAAEKDMSWYEAMFLLLRFWHWICLLMLVFSGSALSLCSWVRRCVCACASLCVDLCLFFMSQLCLCMCVCVC